MRSGSCYHFCQGQPCLMTFRDDGKGCLVMSSNRSLVLKLLAFVALGIFGFCLSAQIPAQAHDSDDGHETMRGPRSVADLAERLMPAVVNISTKSMSNPEGGIPLPNVPEGSPFQEFFDEFFEQEQGSRKRRQNSQSLGSGFVIDASGLIVTNNHVIDDADRISVNFADGKKLEARLLGKDPKTDIALLKVDYPDPLPVVSFGKAQNIRVGDWVMAIGNPFGLGGSVSVGIVSAQNRNINSGPYDSFIQTDAAINRGNSGGPLFDMYGNVVGINTAIISPTGGSIGLGFAIPAEISEKIVAQLRDYGKTRRGWLGIRIQPLAEIMARRLGVDEAAGVLVAWVNEEGPAAEADLTIQDVIVRFDNKAIKEVRDMTRLVAEAEIGAVVPVEVIRKGKRLKLEIKIGQLDEGRGLPLPKAAPGPEKVSLFGMGLSMLNDDARDHYGHRKDIKGVLVRTVDRKSMASDKGVAAGSVIVEMDQEIVSMPETLLKRVEELRARGQSTTILLLAKPGGGELVFVSLKLQ